MVILLFVSATFVLSVIVGLFCTLTISPNIKRQVGGFDLFTKISFGSFVGGIVGGIVGLIIFAVIIALTPESDGGILLGLGVLSAYIVPFSISAVFFLVCWFVGIVAGTTKSIRNLSD